MCRTPCLDITSEALHPLSRQESWSVDTYAPLPHFLPKTWAMGPETFDFCLPFSRLAVERGNIAVLPQTRCHGSHEEGCLKNHFNSWRLCKWCRWQLIESFLQRPERPSRVRRWSVNDKTPIEQILVSLIQWEIKTKMGRDSQSWTVHRNSYCHFEFLLKQEVKKNEDHVLTVLKSDEPEHTVGMPSNNTYIASVIANLVPSQCLKLFLRTSSLRAVKGIPHLKVWWHPQLSSSYLFYSQRTERQQSRAPAACVLHKRATTITCPFKEQSFVHLEMNLHGQRKKHTNSDIYSVEPKTSLGPLLTLVL